MRILVLKEKHGDRYFQAGSTPEELEAVAAMIVRERLADGYWYLDQDVGKAQAALERGKSMDWLRARSRHEYEGIGLVNTEN